jgi:hypothetical protein
MNSRLPDGVEPHPATPRTNTTEINSRKNSFIGFIEEQPIAIRADLQEHWSDNRRQKHMNEPEQGELLE